MSLNQGTKDAIDAMDNVDKLLIIHYALGVDDTALSLNVAHAFVNTYYPSHDPDDLTNDQLSQATMRQLFRFQREVFIADKAKVDAEAARLAALETADGEIGDNPIDDLPPVEEDEV